MKRSISQTIQLVIFIFSFSSILFAQTDTLSKSDSSLNNILEAKVLRGGIYKTFQEFQQNNPGNKISLSTFQKDNTVDYHIVSKRNAIFLIDNKGIEQVVPEPLWGFSDGTKIYYIDRSYKFNEMEVKGRYCIFSKVVTGSGFGTTNFNSYDIILDFYTGKVQHLTVSYMKSVVLVDDPELLAEFNDDALRAAMIYQYVEKYNQRHPVKLQ